MHEPFDFSKYKQSRPIPYNPKQKVLKGKKVSRLHPTQWQRFKKFTKSKTVVLILVLIVWTATIFFFAKYLK